MGSGLVRHSIEYLYKPQCYPTNASIRIERGKMTWEIGKKNQIARARNQINYKAKIRIFNASYELGFRFLI